MISIHLCYMNHRRIIYKDSERRVQRQTEIAFPIWLCRTASYLRIYKDSERWAQRQTKITFPTWLCRTASYLRSDKDTYKREQSKTKLALILFCRAEVSSSFNSKIVKVKCRGKRKSYFQLCYSTLIFHKYSERWAQRQAKITFSAWLCRTASDILQI